MTRLSLRTHFPTCLSLDLQLDLGEVDGAGHHQLGGPAGAARPEDLPVGRLHRPLAPGDSSPVREGVPLQYITDTARKSLQPKGSIM